MKLQSVNNCFWSSFRCVLIVRCTDSSSNKIAVTILSQVLDHKIAFLKEQSFREARGAADVKDVLEKLKVKGGFYLSTILWLDKQY